MHKKSDIKGSTLYNVYNGRVKTLSADNKQKIADAYPELSPSWLLSGTGQMLATSAPAIIQSAGMGDNNNSGSVIVNDSEALSSLIDTNRQLVEQQGRLIQIIEKLTLGQ